MVTANSLAKLCVIAGVLEVSRMAQTAAAGPGRRTAPSSVYPTVRITLPVFL